MLYKPFKVQVNYLEHVLTEGLLVLLPKPGQDHLAELREEDEAVPGDLVGHVHDLLLHGIQSQHLHGSQ